MANIDSGYEIVVIKGEDKGKTIPLKFREIHLGRRSQGDREPNWAYFAEPTVSRHHATLVWDEARRHFTLYHKSRTNPTLVNGKPVQNCALAHDDMVQVGLLVFRMSFVGTQEARGGGESRAAAVTPPPNPRRQPSMDDSEEQSLVRSGLKLFITEGPDRGSVYVLDKPVLFIGRRQGFGDLRAVNGILLNDDGLPKEQVLLAWNEREQTYGIIQAETSVLPTRILRKVEGEFQSIHLDPSMNTLLRLDDVVWMGETAMQVRLDTDELPDLDADDDVKETGEVVVRAVGASREPFAPPPVTRHPSFTDTVVQDDDNRLPASPLRTQSPPPDVQGRQPPSAMPYERPPRQPLDLESRTPIPPPSPETDPSSAETASRSAPATPPPPLTNETFTAPEIRFPTLDVNFVRSLPTGPPVGGRPEPPRMTGLPPPIMPMQPVEDLFRSRDERPPVQSRPPMPSLDPLAGPGLPSHYRPPELGDGEDEDERTNFGETFSWKYRADYVIGFLEGRLRGQKIELLTSQLQDGREIYIGSRGDRFNEVEVDDPGVPNEAAVVTYHGGRFTLKSQGAPNSVFLNQIALAPGEEILLKTGDRISLGESVLMFLERNVVQMLSKYELNVVAGIPEDRGRTFDMLKEVVVIGRLKACDIVLADPEVSRKHLAITLRGGRFYVTHLSSSNPTFINGVSLPRGKDRIVNEGDKIQLSDHTVMVFRPRPQAPPRKK